MVKLEKGFLIWVEGSADYVEEFETKINREVKFLGEDLGVETSIMPVGTIKEQGNLIGQQNQQIENLTVENGVLKNSRRELMERIVALESDIAKQKETIAGLHAHIAEEQAVRHG